LLITFLFVTPLLMPAPRPALDATILKVIPWQTVDSLFSGGGNPKAKPQDTPAVETPPAPQPAPPQPQPPAPEPVTRTPEREAPTKPTTETAQATVTTGKPKVNVSTTVTKRNSQDAEAAKAKLRSEAAARQAAAEKQARQKNLDAALARVGGTASALSQGLSGATAVEVPGPGGAAYANYRDVVYSMYYHAWVVPADAIDSSASVRVRIRIRRDGQVINEEIQARSGNSGLDRSVQTALDRVRLSGLPPFPETSKDSERFFILKFTPAEKLGSG
jgi:TonB family protein